MSLTILRQLMFDLYAPVVSLSLSFLTFCFFVLLFSSSVVEAADIEAVTDSTDGSSSFAVKNSSNVEQAHIDSTGNLVAKGCVRVDSGLIECSETEGLIVDGNVGIGTVNPLSKLQVVAGLSRFGLAGTLNNVSGAGDVYVQNNLEVDGILYGDASGLFNLPSGAGGWIDSGSNVYQATTTDLVGIGTTTPSTTLEIVKQGTNAPLMISSVPTGDGDLLAVSPAGNVGIGTINPQEILDLAGRIFIANTAAPVPTTNRIYASGGNLFWNGTQLDTGATLSGWTDGGTNIYTLTTTDNVGIGTTTPTATLLVENVSAVDSFRVNDQLLDTTPFIIGPGGNVGVGTTDPAAALAVGSASQFQVNTTGAITAVTGVTTTGGYVQTGTGVNVLSGNVGLGTATPVGGLTVMTGNVGIGTWSPIGSLEVRGGTAARIWTGAGTDTNATAAGELYVEGDLEVDGTIYGDGSGITALPSGLPAGGWVDGGTNVYQTTTTDNVGIGTTTPATTFEIVKSSSRSPMMISSVTTGAGDYLIVRSSGNVGVGTVGPSATLTVNGTLSMEPSAVANITAGGGVTATKAIVRIQGSGGAVDISANPQIVVGVDGQMVTLQGMSNANTVLLENGTGLRLQGGVAFTMGLGDTLTLMYDSSVGAWTEIARVDN